MGEKMKIDDVYKFEKYKLKALMGANSTKKFGEMKI